MYSWDRKALLEKALDTIYTQKKRLETTYLVNIKGIETRYQFWYLIPLQTEF